MKYFLSFDAKGVMNGGFIVGINTIPEGAVGVDEAQWWRVTQETDGVWKIDDHGIIAKHPMPPPSEESLIAVALARRDDLLNVATARIAPLQDAYDLGDATAEENETLISWKRYRVALNRIERQVGFPQHIDWPDQPISSRASSA